MNDEKQNIHNGRLPKMGSKGRAKIETHSHNSSGAGDGAGARNETIEKMKAAWYAMKARCNNPAARWFPYYGGRGIQVCKRWSESFEAFLSDMGARPDGMTLERVDNGGNYEPLNCRWASRADQMRNTRHTRMLEHNGQVQSMAVWAHKLGIPPSTLRTRLNRGWPMEQVMKPGWVIPRTFPLQGLRYGPRMLENLRKQAQNS
jgi:hypothetical protein